MLPVCTFWALNVASLLCLAFRAGGMSKHHFMFSCTLFFRFTQLFGRAHDWKINNIERLRNRDYEGTKSLSYMSLKHAEISYFLFPKIVVPTALVNDSFLRPHCETLWIFLSDNSGCYANFFLMLFVPLWLPKKWCSFAKKGVAYWRVLGFHSSRGERYELVVTDVLANLMFCKILSNKWRWIKLISSLFYRT